MRPFRYLSPENVSSATQMLTANQHAKFLAGGTNIIDLMKEDVERPDELVDITRLNFSHIKTISERRE